MFLIGGRSRTKKRADKFVQKHPKALPLTHVSGQRSDTHFLYLSRIGQYALEFGAALGALAGDRQPQYSEILPFSPPSMIHSRAVGCELSARIPLIVFFNFLHGR